MPAFPRLLPILLLTASATGAEPLSSLQAQGQEVYDGLCADCHGPEGRGDVGTDIRGASVPVVRRAVKGFDEMPEIELTVEELDATVAYLGHLADITAD